MKSCLFALALGLFAITSNALAHVEPGVYKGHKADGSECSFTAGKTFFEKETRHPLMERVEISVGNDAFVVAHPPVLNGDDSYVFFDHDRFQGFLPTSTGAKALEVMMEHSERFEGPVSFRFIENNWRTKERSGFQCLDLVFQK